MLPLYRPCCIPRERTQHSFRAGLMTVSCNRCEAPTLSWPYPPPPFLPPSSSPLHVKESAKASFFFFSSCFLFPRIVGLRWKSFAANYAVVHSAADAFAHTLWAHGPTPCLGCVTVSSMRTLALLQRLLAAERSIKRASLLGTPPWPVAVTGRQGTGRSDARVLHFASSRTACRSPHVSLFTCFEPNPR